MKITIGSLIRKELENPDSEMSVAVREFRAYVRLAKNVPKEYKVSVCPYGRGGSGDSFNYFVYDPPLKQWREVNRSSIGRIGKLLKLEGYYY